MRRLTKIQCVYQMSFHLNTTKKLINGAAGVTVLYLALSCPCPQYLKCHKTEYLLLLGVMAGFALIQ